MHLIQKITSLLVLGLSVAATPLCTSYSQGPIVNGSVDIGRDPLTHFDTPRINTYNSSVVEDWSFDGVSDDGSAAIGITFSRGTTAGNIAAQRVMIAVVWPNGTRYLENVFADESIVQLCPDTTTGTWSNRTSGASWKFESSSDNKQGLVTINSTTIQGSYTLSSLAPAVYPNGLLYPDSKGDTLFAPQLYWVETVPVATVQAALHILGSPFEFSGLGGREHNWNANGWGDISADWDMARAEAGPYRLIIWRYKSNVDGQTYLQIILIRDSTVVFRASSPHAVEKKNFGSIERVSDGAVHLSSDPASPQQAPTSRFTGYNMDFLAPGTGEHWQFHIEFTKCVFWFPATDSVMYGAFGGNITGGLVGEQQYEGKSSGNVFEGPLED